MSEPRIRVVNECVGCTDIGMRCMGSSCPNRAVERAYCHRCRDEAGDTLYCVAGDLMGENWDDDDAWICYDCLSELADEREVDTDDLVLERMCFD